jgi:SagB-type dehydrogenase family enzyme
VTRPTPTAEFASLVYGPQGVPLDDPAEAFHEASRLYPNVAPGRLRSMLAITQNPELQQTLSRSTRTHEHRPSIGLPEGSLPPVPLRDLLARRRSSLVGGRHALGLNELAALLRASYRAVPRDAVGLRRPVPSGGALYPLELYVVALEVDGLDPCVAHYDPTRHRLSLLGSASAEETRAAIVDPTLVDRAAALVVVTAMFWRSRFKYGARGYRFALLEAGHVMQNAVLAATALELSALPLGGFFDCRLDTLVHADGLDESSIYGLLIGSGL